MLVLLRLGGVVVSTLGACVGLLLVARSGDDGALGRGIAVLAAGDVVLGLALYAGPGALDLRRAGERWRDAVRPGAWALGAQVLVGWALFPLSHPDDDPDWSWFALVPVLALLGVVAVLVAQVVWVLVVVPVGLVVVHLPGAVRGRAEDVRMALLGGLFACLVPFGVLMSLCTPDGRRASLPLLVSVLLGLEDSAGAPGWALWGARATTVLLVVLLVAVVRAWRGRSLDAP